VVKGSLVPKGNAEILACLVRMAFLVVRVPKETKVTKANQARLVKKAGRVTEVTRAIREYQDLTHRALSD